MYAITNTNDSIITTYRSIDKQFIFIESQNPDTQQLTITAKIQSLSDKAFHLQCLVPPSSIQKALPPAKPRVVDSVALKWLLKNGYYPRFTNKSISFHAGLLGGGLFEGTLQRANRGDPVAQTKIGKMYLIGEVVKRSNKKAVEWFKKAAEQEHAAAQRKLGVMYSNGWGVEKSYKKAFEWYTKSADQGNVDAQFYLGEMYKDGQGVEQSYEKAFEWYTKAAKKGHTDAQNLLEKLPKRLDPKLEPTTTTSWNSNTNPQNLTNTDLDHGSREVTKHFLLLQKEVNLLKESSKNKKDTVRDLQNALSDLSIDPDEFVDAMDLLREWKGELEEICKTQQGFKIESKEQRDIINHPMLGDYYEVVWMRLSDTFLACKAMHSGHMDNTFDSRYEKSFTILEATEKTDKIDTEEGENIIKQITNGVVAVTSRVMNAGTVSNVVEVLTEVAESIPFVSIAAKLGRKIARFVGEGKKREAVSNIARACRNPADIGPLTEVIARHLTQHNKKVLTSIKESSPSTKKRFMTRWQEFRRYEYITQAKKLAVGHADQIIKAIAIGELPDGTNIAGILVKVVVPGCEHSLAFGTSLPYEHGGHSSREAPERVMREQLKQMKTASGPSGNGRPSNEAPKAVPQEELNQLRTRCEKLEQDHQKLKQVHQKTEQDHQKLKKEVQKLKAEKSSDQAVSVGQQAFATSSQFSNGGTNQQSHNTRNIANLGQRLQHLEQYVASRKESDKIFRHHGENGFDVPPDPKLLEKQQEILNEKKQKKLMKQQKEVDESERERAKPSIQREKFKQRQQEYTKNKHQEDYNELLERTESTDDDIC